MNFFNGKKTYLLALLGVIYAVSGYFTGHLDSQGALSAGWMALVAAALRHGMQ